MWITIYIYKKNKSNPHIPCFKLIQKNKIRLTVYTLKHNSHIHRYNSNNNVLIDNNKIYEIRMLNK